MELIGGSRLCPHLGASLAVYEGTVLVYGVHSSFALAVQQRPKALPQVVLASPRWTAYTIGGFTAQAPLSANPLQDHTRVLSAMAAAAPAALPPFDVVHHLCPMPSQASPSLGCLQQQYPRQYASWGCLRH